MGEGTESAMNEFKNKASDVITVAEEKYKNMTEFIKSKCAEYDAAIKEKQAEMKKNAKKWDKEHTEAAAKMILELKAKAKAMKQRMIDVLKKFSPVGVKGRRLEAKKITKPKLIDEVIGKVESLAGKIQRGSKVKGTAATRQWVEFIRRSVAKAYSDFKEQNEIFKGKLKKVSERKKQLLHDKYEIFQLAVHKCKAEVAKMWKEVEHQIHIEKKEKNPSS